MKVLIGSDGSPSARVAIDLVAGLPWPDGSVIRLVTGVDVARSAGPFVGFAPVELGGLSEDLLALAEVKLEAAARLLEAPGRRVEHVVASGRAADAIVEGAADLGADLIVVGSRGLGSVRSLVLGSVSAEVVDRAPCPVLVARRSTIKRLMLGHDGSDQASLAEQLVAGWPILAGLPVDVVSVVSAHEPWAGTLPAAGDGTRAEVYSALAAHSRRHHEDLARATAERIGRAGHATSWDAPAGDPADCIATEAERRSADLIVVGTHGRTGLDRLLLGSVARKVLMHAGCSVLVARPLDHHRAVAAAA